MTILCNFTQIFAIAHMPIQSQTHLYIPARTLTFSHMPLRTRTCQYKVTHAFTICQTPVQLHTYQYNCTRVIANPRKHLHIHICTGKFIHFIHVISHFKCILVFTVPHEYVQFHTRFIIPKICADLCGFVSTCNDV
jgi:hypothetical protein